LAGELAVELEHHLDVEVAQLCRDESRFLAAGQHGAGEGVPVRVAAAHPGASSGCHRVLRNCYEDGDQGAVPAGDLKPVPEA
jgi:hypothetical protein